jgi:hypothetical protein
MCISNDIQWKYPAIYPQKLKHYVTALKDHNYKHEQIIFVWCLLPFNPQYLSSAIFCIMNLTVIL